MLTAKAFPDAMPNRVDTWQSRIENFSSNNAEEGYQVEKAKIAIATGGLTGNGPGKSVQKELFTTIFFRFYLCNYCRRIWVDWSVFGHFSVFFVAI